ncbi:hypothetical protein IHQ68_08065 [Chelatococcus sambhunathii]|uniref:Uncharacterized protein n=1 Tax=Chelatococcus sambhunathii TaxID=363953 RepID=A0ABU1DEN0_9HYPH|nr:hypothetical protein [Chelatococcus sambhunathii]MDR4306570.1 hypothetical protein [Chelatococcus sambhunathii]
MTCQIANVRLWQAVVVQAIADATTMGDHARKDREQARAWLMQPNGDLEEVCVNAALDPRTVRAEAARLIAEADMKPKRGKKVAQIIHYDGLSLTIAEWAERSGISANTLHQRVRNGWPVERMLTEHAQLSGRGQRKSGGGYLPTSVDRLGTGGGSSAQDCS